MVVVCPLGPPQNAPVPPASRQTFSCVKKTLMFCPRLFCSGSTPTVRSTGLHVTWLHIHSCQPYHHRWLLNGEGLYTVLSLAAFGFSDFLFQIAGPKPLQQE